VRSYEETADILEYGGGPSGRTYIGGCDTDSVGTWRWISGEPWDWNPDGFLPDAYVTEYCLETYVGFAPWGLNTIWCEYVSYGQTYTCEFDEVDRCVSAGGVDDLDCDGSGASEGDCDDTDASVSLGGPEVCNFLDDDCDGRTDAADDDLADGTTFYRDADRDGYGTTTDTRVACFRPPGYVSESGDCDDGDAAVLSCPNPDDGTVCPTHIGRDDGLVPTWDGGCDTGLGFVLEGGRCWFAVASVGTWEDARASCNGAGGYLAVPGDATESAFVDSLAERVHIGGCDADTEGAWTWATGDAWTYADWAEGEPNGGAASDCLEMIRSGLWADRDCATTDGTTGYVCEFG
jgi:hypothetical protein